MARIGIRVCDLVGDFSRFEDKLHTLVEEYQKRFPTLHVDKAKELAAYREYGAYNDDIMNGKKTCEFH